jgi:NAD(P)-dependent dehydrogenase (short-subunit alcohol dehydrogenase family)
MKGRVSAQHRTAFVTGAASGLGRAFTTMLLDEGVRVWGTSRDPARLAGLGGARVESPFIPVALDLADGAAAEAAFRRAAGEAGGAFDLVINNAGYGVFGDFAETPAEIWLAQIDALLLATLRLNRAAFGLMRARGRGCLVNISSLAAEFPLPFMAGYNVAKAGLSALSESLIFESRGTGVTVIDFRPGDYRTAFNDAMKPSSSPHDAPAPPRRAAAWRVLERNLRASPPAARAAADLRRALRRNRSGVVRSGSWFQASAAPFLARLAPAALVRAATARYFGCR